MWQRVKAVYLDRRLHSPKPEVQAAAIEGLVALWPSAAETILKLAVQTQASTYQYAQNTLQNKILAHLEPASQKKLLTEFVNTLADKVATAQLMRERYGRVLIGIGAPAWERMLARAAQKPDTAYMHFAYHTLPQFWGHLPPQSFIDLVMSPPHPILGAQASSLLKNFDFSAFGADFQLNFWRQAIQSSGHVPMRTKIHQNALETHGPALLNYGQAGMEVLSECWFSDKPLVRQMALSLSIEPHFLPTYCRACHAESPILRYHGIQRIEALMHFFGSESWKGQQDLILAATLAALDKETYQEDKAAWLCAAVCILARLGDARAIAPLEALLRSLPPPDVPNLAMQEASREHPDPVDEDDEETDENTLESLRHLLMNIIMQLKRQAAPAP
jgi:hypothetical protein